MILLVEERKVFTKRYFKSGKTTFVAIVSCDVCKNSFELPASYAKKLTVHTCNDLCNRSARQVNGVLYEQIVATNVKKYGAKFASETSDTKNKQETTNIRKYGVKATSQNVDVEQKRLKTCIEKYGGPAATSDSNVVEKAKKTTVDRYGGPVLKNSLIRSQVTNTMIERYGVSWASQSKEILAKQHATNIKKYGVKFPFHTSIAKDRCRSKTSVLKRHQTMKSNSSYGKSKVENAYYDHLISKFGIDNVQCQVLMNDRWPIDFYVKSIDTYIQFDGVYWHGLDRPIEIIAEHRTLRDAQIHNKWITDRKQDAWFIEQNLKLVRITDKDFIHKTNVI